MNKYALCWSEPDRLHIFCEFRKSKEECFADYPRKIVKIVKCCS